MVESYKMTSFSFYCWSTGSEVDRDGFAYEWRPQASIFIAYKQIDYTGIHDDVDHKDLAEINYLFFREFIPTELSTFAYTKLHESIQELNLSV